MFGRRILAAMAFAGVGLCAGQGLAQEDLTRGKTAVQLYASDCVECHKNPRALGKRDNPGSLSAFLRVHYTASRESASAIAAYLVSLGPEQRGSRPAGTARQRPAQEQGKPEQGKAEHKPAAAEAAKPTEAAKPAEAPAKPAEPAPEKPAESAPSAPAAAPAATPPADPQ